MTDEVEKLRRAVKWRATRRASSTVGLGDALNEFMTSRVSPRQGRFSLIAEAWDQMLPSELCRHCRIVDVSGGRLKVAVDSPSYMYELQLSSSELLEELERRCPGARIEEIKFAIG
jgi:predicted nucleic acid-binding Zn ribbon protein